MAGIHSEHSWGPNTFTSGNHCSTTHPHTLAVWPTRWITKTTAFQEQGFETDDSAFFFFVFFCVNWLWKCFRSAGVVKLSAHAQNLSFVWTHKKQKNSLCPLILSCSIDLSSASRSCFRVWLLHGGLWAWNGPVNDRQTDRHIKPSEMKFVTLSFLNKTWLGCKQWSNYFLQLVQRAQTNTNPPPPF